MDEKTKNCLVMIAALFLILSCSTASLDIYTIWKKLFYRFTLIFLFYANFSPRSMHKVRSSLGFSMGPEQKTPFLTALTAIFAMTASTSRFASTALPV
ncbi:hypothetical protein KIN20_004658, partial [Parelaphostrongylus tenuis]